MCPHVRWRDSTPPRPASNARGDGGGPAHVRAAFRNDRTRWKAFCNNQVHGNTARACARQTGSQRPHHLVEQGPLSTSEVVRTALEALASSPGCISSLATPGTSSPSIRSGPASVPAPLASSSGASHSPLQPAAAAHPAWPRHHGLHPLPSHPLPPPHPTPPLKSRPCHPRSTIKANPSSSLSQVTCTRTGRPPCRSILAARARGRSRGAEPASLPGRGLPLALERARLRPSPRQQWRLAGGRAGARLGQRLEKVPVRRAPRDHRSSHPLAPRRRPDLAYDLTLPAPPRRPQPRGRAEVGLRSGALRTRASQLTANPRYPAPAAPPLFRLLPAREDRPAIALSAPPLLFFNSG